MPENRLPQLQIFSVLESLPCIKAKLNEALDGYHVIKHSSIFSTIGFWFLEALLTTWWNLGLICLSCVPADFFSSEPVALVDELICHQLEFIERKFSNRTGTEYKVRNHFLQRFFKLVALVFRLLFLWPRIMTCLFSTTWSIISNEFREDSKLFVDIFSNKLSRPRRATTRVPKKQAVTSPCKRKRKHEEALEGEVEQYLFVNESYQSENDPDYEIGETTCDFDGSSTGTESGEECVDTKGFLCQECIDECGNNEYGKNSDEEFDGSQTSDDEEQCDGNEDTVDNIASNCNDVREITVSVRPEMIPEVPPVVDVQKVGAGSPTCKKG